MSLLARAHRGIRPALGVGSAPWSRIRDAVGLLALGSAIAITPPWVSAAAFAGVLVFVLLLVQPLVGVFLLAWSVPFQSLVATTLGEFRVSVTEVLVLLYVAAALLSLRRTRGLPRPLLLLPGLVLFAVLMLSILRSQDIESSLEEIIQVGRTARRLRRNGGAPARHALAVVGGERSLGSGNGRGRSRAGADARPHRAGAFPVQRRADAGHTARSASPTRLPATWSCSSPSPCRSGRLAIWKRDCRGSARVPAWW